VKKKLPVVMILAVIVMAFCLVMVTVSGKKVSKIQKDLEVERYNRMSAEERLDESLSKIKALQSDIANAQNQAQGVGSVLEQQKTVVSNLKSELDKVMALNAKLEQDLKNATSAQQEQIQPPIEGSGPK